MSKESLEKKIHKSALIETVAVLNDTLDDSGRKKKAFRKKVMNGADNHGLTHAKQKRNEMRKVRSKDNNASKKQKNDNVPKNKTEKHESDEIPRKMTRKDRRIEKMKSKGRGVSSKEYYEKFIKKSESHAKNTIPSKRKDDFQKNDRKKARKR